MKRLLFRLGLIALILPLLHYGPHWFMEQSRQIAAVQKFRKKWNRDCHDIGGHHCLEWQRVA